MPETPPPLTPLEQDVIDSGGFVFYSASLSQYTNMYNAINDAGGYPQLLTIRALPETSVIEVGTNGKAILQIQEYKTLPYGALLAPAIAGNAIQQITQADYLALRQPVPELP